MTSSAPHTLPRIGIQLYSVRNLTDPSDFRETLTRLADLGFQGVEFAWKYGDMPADQLAEFLRSLNLSCCGLHVQLDELLQPDHPVYEIAKAVESPWVTISLAGRESQWDQLLPSINSAAKIAVVHGLTLTYHNHWQEFNAAPGESAYDQLVEFTATEPVGLEIDLGWVHKAGVDALSLWRRLGKRTPQVHLRDYDRTAQQVCDVGDGFMDLKLIWQQAIELDTAWLIYEQDRYPVDPFESARVCIERLHATRADSI